MQCRDGWGYSPGRPAIYDEGVPVVDRVSAARASAIGRRYYGITGTAERQASEHDDTFRLTAGDGTSRLLKIGAVDDVSGGAGGASFPTAVLAHLFAVAPELPVQRVIATLDGRPEISGPDELPGRLVRMTSWLDGALLGREATGAALRRDIGATLARLNLALRGLRHPGARRTHRWDLQNFGRLRPLLAELPDRGQSPAVRAALALTGLTADTLRAALAGCLDHFDAAVAPRLAGLPVQVIHTDFHGENLLTAGGRVTGILDFGDALAGPVAMDVGIAACYQLGAASFGSGSGSGSAGGLLAPALDVVAGYHAVDPLDGVDLDLVAEFLMARVAARIILSQAHAAREPANRGYLLRRTPQAIEHFDALLGLGRDALGGRLRAAIDLEEPR